MRRELRVKLEKLGVFEHNRDEISEKLKTANVLVAASSYRGWVGCFEIDTDYMRAMPKEVENHCIWMAALDAHVLDKVDGIENYPRCYV